MTNYELRVGVAHTRLYFVGSDDLNAPNGERYARNNREKKEKLIADTADLRSDFRQLPRSYERMAFISGKL